MKVSTIICLVSLAMVIAAGCDRKPPEPEPSKYDAEFDGPPLTVAVVRDPLLLADQEKISSEAGLPPVSPGPGTREPDTVGTTPKPDANTAPPPTGDVPAHTVTEIKAAIDGYAAALEDTENLDKLSAFIAEDQDVKVARTILEKTAALAKKNKALRQLVQDKLAMELPPDKKTAPVSLPGSQLQAAKENLKFQGSDDAVLVTGRRGMKATFVKADNRWKVRYSAMDRRMLELQAKLAQAIDSGVDEMRSGIEDGTITKANFEAKKQAIGKEKIGPVLEEMTQLMMGGVGRPPTAPTPKPKPGPPDEGADKPAPKAPPPPAGAVEAVKATVEEIAKAAAKTPGTYGPLADFVVDEDARTVRKIAEGMKKFRADLKGLHAAMKDKLGVANPERTMMMMGPMGAGLPFPPPGGELHIKHVRKRLRYEAAGQAVKVTPRGRGPLTFVKADGRWKIRYDAKQRKLAGLAIEYAAALQEWVAQTRAAIDKGEIDKKNVHQKAMALYQKTVDPAMRKIMRESGMGGRRR